MKYTSFHGCPLPRPWELMSTFGFGEIRKNVNLDVQNEPPITEHPKSAIRVFSE